MSDSIIISQKNNAYLDFLNIHIKHSKELNGEDLDSLYLWNTPYLTKIPETIEGVKIIEANNKMLYEKTKNNKSINITLLGRIEIMNNETFVVINDYLLKTKKKKVFKSIVNKSYIKIKFDCDKQIFYYERVPDK
jgi:hypothetical protein